MELEGIKGVAGYEFVQISGFEVHTSPTGQTGDPESLTVQVDAEPPKVRISRSPPRRATDGPGAFQFQIHAEDETGIDWIKYRVNRGQYLIYTAPLQLDSDRDYLIECSARDIVGNESPVLEVAIEREDVPSGE